MDEKLKQIRKEIFNLQLKKIYMREKFMREKTEHDELDYVFKKSAKSIFWIVGLWILGLGILAVFVGAGANSITKDGRLKIGLAVFAVILFLLLPLLFVGLEKILSRLRDEAKKYAKHSWEDGLKEGCSGKYKVID